MTTNRFKTAQLHLDQGPPSNDYRLPLFIHLILPDGAEVSLELCARTPGWRHLMQVCIHARLLSSSASEPRETTTIDNVKLCLVVVAAA